MHVECLVRSAVIMQSLVYYQYVYEKKKKQANKLEPRGVVAVNGQ